MNKKTISELSLAILLMLTIAACTKPKVLADYPTITITTPSQWQSISSGTPIHITGTATAGGSDDSHLLHEVAITIKTLPDSTIVFSTVYNTHEMQSFNIDTTFTPIVTSTTEMIVVGQAVNHLYKIATQNVGVTVIP